MQTRSYCEACLEETGDGSKSLFSVILNSPISYTDFDSIFYGTKEKESGFMNRKLVVRNKFGNVVYCVLSGAQPFRQQLEKVLGVTPGHGLSVEMNDKKVLVRDYFAGENVGEFEIISFEETNLQQNLNWINE